MDRPDESTYFARRAEQERERARQATDATVASVHQSMASEYERRNRIDMGERRITE